MNLILARMLLASLIKSVKNPQKKEELKAICKEAVQTILLAYSDDPHFLDDTE